MISAYLQARTWVEQGLYEKASRRLRQMRSDSTAADAQMKYLRTLVAARIAIKASGGNALVDDRELDPSRVSDPFLRAEGHFVRGLLYFHRRLFKLGMQEFQKAASGYRKLGPSFVERELLSSFNAYCGMTNLPDFAQSSQELLQIARGLERRAFEAKNKKILGLILRDKSEYFQILGRYKPALEDAEQSVRLLELYGAKSDYDLAVIQAADCCMDSGRAEKARGLLERVLLPVDKRAEFPLALVQARLDGRSIDPAAYEVVVPCSLAKWKRQFSSGQSKSGRSGKQKMYWNLSSQELQLKPGQRIVRLKPGSLEGKLLKVLSGGKASKAQLCEMLWPEACNRLLLDNRLHRLVSRTNRKLSNLIRFDGSHYSVIERLETTI